jgi:phosphoribosylaminoimidazolecarboxamide formyltransferase/IMP cyclohydrolase
MKYALLSVSDKSDIVQFSKVLIELGYCILATGKTANLLSQHNLKVQQISDFTSFPEIFDGRVKTFIQKFLVVF